MKVFPVIMALVLLMSLFAVLPISAAPTEVWVDDDGPDNGTDHFDTIQEGINAVEAGGTVHVAAGTYNEYINISSKDISLVGDGPAVTTINAGSGNSAIWAQFLSNATLIEGFTVTNGSRSQGGGITNADSSAVINNCIFTGNYGGGEGGGMFNAGGSPTVTNCTFSNNTATKGGGVNIYSGNPIFTNCTFSGNTATSGGGLYCFIGTATLTNCTFSGNTVSAQGGGMHNEYSYSISLTNCTLSGNTAQDGGGIYNYYVNPSQITNCTFSANTASRNGGGMYDCVSYSATTGCTFSGNSAQDGGGMYNDMSSSSVANCTFSGNASSSQGGGICNWYSSPTVNDCVLTGNTAPYGAGMYNYGVRGSRPSEPIITNCVIYDNTASGDGGGMYNDHAEPIITNCTISCNSALYGAGILNWYYSPILTNCIIWGNASDNIHDVSSTPIVTYSDIGGGYTGEGNIDEDPLFVDPGSGNYAIPLNSPCFDAGTDTSSPSFGGVIDDMLGTPRPQFDEYDMGAYEAIVVNEAISWSPIVMKPLVMVTLSKANTIWGCLLQQLPEEVPENVLELLDDVQVHMANAAMLSNPVYANGELNKAMSLMEQINDVLDCGCYLD